MKTHRKRQNKLLKKELDRLSKLSDEEIIKYQKNLYLRSLAYSLSGVCILVLCILAVLFVRW